MNELKNKSLRYQIGYWFFLVIAIIIVSFQAYKYVTNTMDLVWPELIVTLVAGVFVYQPMFLVKGFNAFIKFVTKKTP